MFCSIGCSTKESIAIVLSIICLILLLSITSTKSSEMYARPIPSSASLNAKAEMCLRFGGRITADFKDCLMPPAVQNDQILNWQMAGRVCDLDTIYTTQGCVTYDENDNVISPLPWTQNANRGIFHYNSY
jgi:hypothetical protein